MKEGECSKNRSLEDNNKNLKECMQYLNELRYTYLFALEEENEEETIF